MKLYIDDIRNAPDESWTVARTVTSAIKFIAQFGGEITHISFDHDISYQIELNNVSRPYPSPETFQAVAAYIVQYYQHSALEYRPLISVHSANPVGSEAIMRTLGDMFGDVKYEPMGAANRLETEV